MAAPHYSALGAPLPVPSPAHAVCRPLGDRPLGGRPLMERVGALRAFVRSYPTMGEAAAALGVSAGTLRRNLDTVTATAGALDVIEEGLPDRTVGDRPGQTGPEARTDPGRA